MAKNVLKKLVILLSIFLIELFSFKIVNYASVSQGTTLSPSRQTEATSSSSPNDQQKANETYMIADNHPIYQQPKKDNDTDNASESLDDMMNDADDFVRSGGNVQYDEGALQDFSSNIYNILLTVGVAVAVIVGGILGIKLMLSSVEEKAETKKLLIAYAVGCVIVFGGFGIWKLVITVLEGM